MYVVRKLVVSFYTLAVGYGALLATNSWCQLPRFERDLLLMVASSLHKFMVPTTNFNLYVVMLLRSRIDRTEDEW